MEPIGTIRFRFTFCIDPSDYSGIQKHMDRVIREAEDYLNDTNIWYRIATKDLCCVRNSVLRVQWTVNNISILDRDERNAIRGVVVHNLRPLIDKYILVFTEESVL